MKSVWASLNIRVSEFSQEKIHVLWITISSIFIRCLSLLILEENLHPFNLFLPLTPNLAIAQGGVSRHAHYGDLASLAPTPVTDVRCELLLS